jgi:hypothetical protein
VIEALIESGRLMDKTALQTPAVAPADSPLCLCGCGLPVLDDAVAPAERETAIREALEQIAQLGTVHEPERGQDQRPPMVVALERWTECVRIAKAALAAPAPTTERTFTLSELTEAVQLAVERTIQNARDGYLDHRLAAPPPAPKTDDPTCIHGTALDVHCCNCHGGFLFEGQTCTCTFPASSS